MIDNDHIRGFNETARFRLPLLRLAGIALIFVGACSSMPDQSNWILIGQTTREEVLEAYGPPDLVMSTQEGDLAVYRPRDTSPASQLRIPTAQIGPFGTSITKMEPVTPGLGARRMNGGRLERPPQELRIRYNTQGIVTELIR
jgi:hypothetical protein